MKNRKEIELDSEQHEALCCDKELTVEGIEFQIVLDEYLTTKRHTEVHRIVFGLNGEFYEITYEISVKDSMGWKDCNWGKAFKAVQVFPREVTITIYE